VRWVCRFSVNAERDLRRLPKEFQQSVARVLTQMASGPFQGDVKALHGSEWRGVFRRRMGDYRILFTADHAEAMIVIQQISVRSGKTYR